MKKLLLVLIALTTWYAPVWAQTVNDKSTLKECLTYLNELLSINRYKNYSEYYQVDGQTLKKKMVAVNMENEIVYLPVDWAALSRVEFGEATDELIPVKLVFDRNFAGRELLYSKRRVDEGTLREVQWRNFIQSNEIGLNLPLEKKDEASSLKTGFERLAQLAMEHSDRAAVTADGIAFVEATPQPGSSYVLGMSIAIAIPNWGYSFVGYGDDEYEAYGENTLVFEKLDKNDDPTGEKFWVGTQRLKSINLEGENIIFEGFFEYAKNASRVDRPEYKELFKFPVSKQRPGSAPLDIEEVLRHFRFVAWKYGADLQSDGFEMGQKVYND